MIFNINGVNDANKQTPNLPKSNIDFHCVPMGGQCLMQSVTLR